MRLVVRSAVVETALLMVQMQRLQWLSLFEAATAID